jgi:ribonuclease Y
VEEPEETNGSRAPEEGAEAERGETPDPEELKARLGIKNNHIRELFEQITASRLAADEARATKEASEGHIAALERERARLKERIRSLEEEARGRRRRREAEYELRERLAEPANRLRAGIDLFNDSEQRRSMNSLSRTLGQPEVHVDLDEGQDPAVLLTFTWQGVTWQTYAANPSLAVKDPRIYLKGAGEDLSGVDRQPPNARVGPGGRVLLGL